MSSDFDPFEVAVVEKLYKICSSILYMTLSCCEQLPLYASL